MDDARRFTSAKDRRVNSKVTGISNERHVFMLSAKDEGITKEMVKNLRDHLHSGQCKGDESQFPERLAFTLGSRRTIFP